LDNRKPQPRQLPRLLRSPRLVLLLRLLSLLPRLQLERPVPRPEIRPVARPEVRSEARPVAKLALNQLVERPVPKLAKLVLSQLVERPVPRVLLSSHLPRVLNQLNQPKSQARRPSCTREESLNNLIKTSQLLSTK